ncbi:MAG: hypothetical protein RL518_26 [Pseudomonadota bacterium]
MQSPLIRTDEELSPLFFAGPLLSLREYTTVITNFPGTNCTGPYGATGTFYLDVSIYHQGKKVWECGTAHTDQDGVLHISFDDFIPRAEREIDGILIAEFAHSRSVPVELYITHAHRVSGAYVAYPAAMFLGDEIYSTVHTSEMENALFWPGLRPDERCQHAINVLNPFKVPYQYQLSLFVGDRIVARSEPRKIKPFHYRNDVIEEVFSEHMEEVRAHAGRAAICVSGQFKVLANMVIQHVASGVVTTIDHLHRYILV